MRLKIESNLSLIFEVTMKLNNFLFAIIIFSFLSANIFAQQVTLLKRLDDDAGRFGQKLAPIFDNQPGNVAKQKAIQPFIIGYYGWKAKGLAEFGVGKIEAAHLDICRIMLGLYDSEIDATLKTIVGRAKTPTDWIDVTEAEKKAIHQFVVIKYGGKYLGFDQLMQGKKTSEISEADKWKSMLGTGLGELGGSLVNWYKFPTSTTYPKKISELLLNLQKNINQAPAGTSPELLTNLRKLSALGNKTSYNESERDQVAAALREVLYSTLSFVDLGNSTAQIVSNSSSATPFQQAENYLERGKNYAAKGNYKSAVADYNESIKINPANGIAYYHRAKALEELGEIDKAISDYGSMIAFKTDLRKAYYNRGTLFMDKNSFYLAIEDFNKSLTIDPKYAHAYYNRGLSYYNLNNFDKAIADYSQVIYVNNQNADAYYGRSLCYCQKGQTALALKDQEQAIKLGAKIDKGCSK